MTDTADQAVVGDGHVVPDGGDDLLSVDEPVPVRDEVGERSGERERGDDRLIAAPELAALEVERERTEFHRGRSVRAA